MKKITLIAIIVFIFFIIIIFIGSNSNKTKQQSVSDINITNTLNKNEVKNLKPLVNTIKNDTNQINDITSTKSVNTDINSPNINNLIFNIQQVGHSSFTLNDISKHNTKNDCYLVINNNVYDVSSYIDYHPAGARIIISRCGREVTNIFARIHSNRAWDLLKRYKIGTITTNKLDTTFQILTAISNALKKANPNADILKVSPKVNFYVAKIIYNNKLYEVHINNNGEIIKQEVENDEFDWSSWENDGDDNGNKI